MKILLHENSLNLRGTSVALFDYALYLSKLYGHECLVTYELDNPTNNEKVIQKFQKNFEVIPYKTFQEVDKIIKLNQIDFLYIIKSGANDGKFSKKIKTGIHSVFGGELQDIHGDVYAYVSEWLSVVFSNGQLPFVPHMINLPNVDGDYRKQLNIPLEAKVFGRYGGTDSFDIPFVLDTINETLNEDPSVYFLFCNTPRFTSHPRAIFTNNTACLESKVRFINTCDALIHARHRGETFGLTVLEFMSKNKPILTYGLSREKNHYNLLDGQGYIYNTREELFSLFKHFTPTKVIYNQIDNFKPRPVMEQFCSVFLS